MIWHGFVYVTVCCRFNVLHGCKPDTPSYMHKAFHHWKNYNTNYQLWHHRLRTFVFTLFRTILKRVSYIVWKFRELWAINGWKLYRRFRPSAQILHSASFPGVAYHKRNPQPNFAKRKEVNGADASRIRWRRIVNVNETIEIRPLVSWGPKTY